MTFNHVSCTMYVYNDCIFMHDVLQGSAKTVMIHGFCNKFDSEVHMFKSFNYSSASTPYLFQVRHADNRIYFKL